MAPEAPDELAAAVAAGDDPSAPLRALRWALAWAAAALDELVVADDDVRALEGVIQLDQALEEVPALRRVLPALLDLADTGPDVARHLTDRTAETAAVTARLGPLREAVASASAREEEWRGAVGEHEALQARLVELRRLERLAAALGELEGQRQLIDDRLAALVQPVTGAERAVARGSADLLRLTEERRSALDPQVRDLLERADAAQRDLAASEAAMAAKESELAGLARRHEELLSLIHI